MGWTTAQKEKLQSWWGLSSPLRSEVMRSPQTPLDKLLPGAFQEASVLPGPRRTAGWPCSVGRRSSAGLPYRGLAGRNAVETFAWYNRPLQHSPGILR